MCHDTAVEDLETDKGGTEDLKCSGPETEEHLAASRHHMQEGHVPRDDVIEIAVHPSTQDAIQRRRQHRKDNRRRKWERLRAQKPQASTPKPFDKGVQCLKQ